MTDEQKMRRHDALIELRQRIGGCFGPEDLIFASHKLDEDHAKQLKGFARAEGVTPKELCDISVLYLIDQGCRAEHIAEQRARITKLFNW